MSRCLPSVCSTSPACGTAQLPEEWSERQTTRRGMVKSVADGITERIQWDWRALSNRMCDIQDEKREQ